MKEEQNNNLTETLLTERSVSINDVAKAKYETYKDTPFRNLLGGTVTPSIQGKPEEERASSIRKVNQSFWLRTGVNLLFRKDIYDKDNAFNESQELKQAAAAKKGSKKEYPSRDVRQLFHSDSEILPKKSEAGWASFRSQKTFDMWNDKFQGNSLEPAAVDSEKNTLAHFFRKVSIEKDPESGGSFLTLKGVKAKVTITALPKDTTKDNITVEQLVKLVKSKRVQTAIKTAEEEAAKPEEEKPETVDPSVGMATAPLTPTNTPTVEKYNIRKPKKDGFVGVYQQNLKRFHKIPRIGKVAGNYKAPKLVDSKYGHRTHYMGILTADELIGQIKAHLKTKEVKKESKERRAENLAQLLETRLLGFNSILLVEQNEKNLQQLVIKLEAIKTKLLEQGGEVATVARPDEDRFIDSALLQEYNDILNMLPLTEDGKIDFDSLSKKMAGQATAALPTEKEVPKAPAVARKPAPKPREASCWYAQNITIAGEQATSPNSLWGRTPNVEPFDQWYNKVMEVMNYAGAGASYTFQSGARASYRAQVSMMGTRRSTNINIACFRTIANALNRVLAALGSAAEDNYRTKPNFREALSTQAEYFLNDGVYAGSLAYQCQSSLYKVVMNTMKNEAPKILKAAANLQRRGQVKAAANVAKLVGDKASATFSKGGLLPTATPSLPAGVAAAGSLSADGIAARLVAAAGKKPQFKTKIMIAAQPGVRTPTIIEIGKMIYGDDKLATDTGNMVTIQQAIKLASDILKRPAAAATSESLKQKREGLISELLFDKLVR